jgi:putative FmdB family regulatory protein
MPIYEYQPKREKGCDFCSKGFEVIRKISEPRLLVCPQCGITVERILSAPSLAKSSPSLDPANIEKHGFTQYRKSGKGVYEKTAGKGPNVISDE